MLRRTGVGFQAMSYFQLRMTTLVLGLAFLCRAGWKRAASGLSWVSAIAKALDLPEELHGAHIGLPYSGMWSWDIEGEKCRREQIAGNPRSSRAEMACAYVRPSQPILLLFADIIFQNPNPKVITIDGYCINIPFYPA